ncbi:MAG: hypothetical protein IPL22_08605 [Bacteroidetes bacterium]|nr:hypothetical protein [Bacteroidota bacterium]
MKILLISTLILSNEMKIIVMANPKCKASTTSVIGRYPLGRELIETRNIENIG